MNARSKGAIMAYLYMVVQVVVSLVYVPLLLQTIGKGEYGLYQLVGSVMAYLLIMNATVAAAVQRYYNKYLALGDGDRAARVLGVARRLYWALSGVSALAGLAIIAVANAVYANSFTPAELSELSLMLGVLVANVVIALNNSIYSATIEAHERFAFHNALMLATVVAQLGVVALVVRVWPCALAVALVQLAFVALDAGIRRGYARRRLDVRPAAAWDAELARALLAFSGGILLATVADQVFWRTDQLILGYFFGTGSIAVYGIGAQVFMAYMPLGIAVSSVFLPKVTRIYRGVESGETLSELFVRIGRISFYVLAAVLSAFIIFGDDFVALWAGPGYHEAYLVAVIVMVPFTIDLIQNVGLTILKVDGTYPFRARVYFGVAMANIPLTIALIQPLGIVGAALSTAIALFLGSGLVMNWYYWKRTGIDVPLFWKSICRQAAAPFALFALTWALYATVLPHAESWLAMAGYLLAYSVAYLAICLLFSFNAYEKGLVRSLLHRGRGAR